MNNENLKRLKINEPDVFKMDVDSQAIVLTVIPFLTDYELVNYLATNREMQSYDNDRLWNRIKPKWTRISKRCTKKCIHFERLAYRYTLPQLIDECTNTYQIGLAYFRLFSPSIISSPIGGSVGPSALYLILTSALLRKLHHPPLASPKMCSTPFSAPGSISGSQPAASRSPLTARSAVHGSQPIPSNT